MSRFSSLKLKVVAILLICFSLVDSLSSQSIFTQGHYDYSFNGEGVFGVSEIDYVTKYRVNSDSIYVFQRKRRLKIFNSDEIRERVLDTILIIGNDPDSLVVKLSSGGEKRLLYDFNLEVGSTYRIYPDRSVIQGGIDSMDVTVTEYGDTIISGQRIPYQTVRYTFDKIPYVIVDKLYRGIGSLHRYVDIFDIYFNFIGSGLGGPLVCYNNQDIDYVNRDLPGGLINEVSGQCMTTTSTSDDLLGNEIAMGAVAI